MALVASIGMLAACSPAPRPIIDEDWLPAVADDVPAAVTDRANLGFCGIDAGEGSPARRCFLAVHGEGSSGELGIVEDTDAGQRITIIRSMVSGSSVSAPFPPLPDHWIEVIRATPAAGLPRVWERQACEAVREIDGDDALELVGCERLEAID